MKKYLKPSHLDRHALVGEGFAGRVWRKGRYAIKTAHNTSEARRRIAAEIAIFHEIAAGPWEIAVPRLHAVNDDKTSFVRDFIDGPSLYEVLCSCESPLPEADLDALFALYQATESFREATGKQLDFAPSNLFHAPGQQQYILCDLGLRLDPPRFVKTTRKSLWPALCDYVAWRQALDAKVLLRPMAFPPSGRFHIEVPVGPIKAGRLLWHNTWLSERLKLPWSRREIRQMGGVATHATPCTKTLPASLYQDAAGKGEGFAKGDGRAVYIGEVRETADGPKELMLKGCGPTPLAWHGNEFHEDGLVSFQRTLWETSVAHELARLGFESPEMLAVLGTGQTTVDNTLVEWPAAAAIRTATTHFRVGHMVHWSDDPDAMYAMCQHVGRRLVRPDFAPHKYTHIEALMKQFASNLGWDVGRTDALNIHGFNPTMGNIRIDGHLIDFSTIRFFRHYVPHYKYMNDTRQLREHKAAMRRHPSHLIQHLRVGGLLTQAQDHRLRTRCNKCFEQRYNDGYIDGLCEFLGISPDALTHHSPYRRKALVKDTQHIRKLRAEETITFPFWKQECPAPLFDLEGQMPAFVRAWRRGQSAPWEALRSSFKGRLKPFDACMARSWFENLQRMLTPAQLRQLKPRRWEQIISPFMEVEHLARLCYQRSTPEQFDEWRCHISMARQLPSGTYPRPQAQELAIQRGHLSFPTKPDDDEKRILVGMTKPLYHRILDAVEEIFETTLLGLLAYGTRASALTDVSSPRRQQLVEWGPTHNRTSRLHLLIVLRRGACKNDEERKQREEALRKTFATFGAPFVIGRHPRHPLLWETSEETLAAVYDAMPFALRPETAVILYDVLAGCAPEHAAWRS